jgi:uncharacterized protein (DUF2252 family)
MTTTTAERTSAGRDARSKATRRSHGEWSASEEREDPIDILERQAETRVPELVPIRYGRMLESPFAFYRGSAAVMAADLAMAPSSGINVQLCGDAHLANFGGFASPDRSLIFDINDFDETAPGPFEWDVKRLAASIEVATRARQLRRSARVAAVTAAVREYRSAMQRFAGMRRLDAWYRRMDEKSLFAALDARGETKLIDNVAKRAQKAKTKDSVRALERLTAQVDGQLRIVSTPPLVVAVEELFEDRGADEITSVMRQLLVAYRKTLGGAAHRLMEEYRYVHMARKVVGVGSVGTRAWIVLLTGRDDADPLFLQVKEAQQSVLEPYAGRSRYSHHGRRVVEGQWLMQAASDIFLGWVRATGADGVERDFYVRQLWDWKTSADFEMMEPAAFPIYGQMCGWTLAHAHARSGDPAAIAGYLGKSDAFDNAMVAFAGAYADQAEKDFKLLRVAAKTGRVDAVRLV